MVDLQTGRGNVHLRQLGCPGTTGGRMDRQISGAMTIGGRGANRNFHGKVAAMVVTTCAVASRCRRTPRSA